MIFAFQWNLMKSMNVVNSFYVFSFNASLISILKKRSFKHKLFLLSLPSRHIGPDKEKNLHKIKMIVVPYFVSLFFMEKKLGSFWWHPAGVSVS